MALSLDDIQRIAHLARIEITPAEVSDVAKKLEGIFAMIDRIAAIDTRGIVPMSHVQDFRLPLREDRVTEPDRHELYQSVAPAVQDGLYLVPKVIE
ncbi:MAG: Asp-tRNA(Asn)/Glu-tRNA(Gln) amidotransferase subunit GatC [Casimicrobiaceae bacterium]